MKFKILCILASIFISSCATYKYTDQTFNSKFYDINGHSMHLLTSGYGNCIIFSGGSGVNDPLNEYYPLLNLCKKKATIAVYERAGYGLSEKTNISRNVNITSYELNELFYKAELIPPFILVGHSYAAIELLAYAQIYPEKVKAIVFIDGAPPQYYLKTKLPSQFIISLAAILSGATGLNDEVKSIIKNANIIIENGSIKDIPITYIYAGNNGIKDWKDFQKNFEEFSDYTKAVYIPNSDHSIHNEYSFDIMKEIECFL